MARECQECGIEADKEHGIIVGDWDGYGPICNECQARFLQDDTVLSDRECEVVAYSELGATVPEIAEMLGISESTVRTLRVRIREKVHKAVRTRDELQHWEL